MLNLVATVIYNINCYLDRNYKHLANKVGAKNLYGPMSLYLAYSNE